MSVLIKKALIVDSQSKHHLKTVDILIERGIITSIKKDIKSDSKNIIEGKSLNVSPGWIDLHAEFNDPGFEHKEDLVSGSAAAKNGGFSTVVVSANNYPVTDNKSQINYLKSRAKELSVDVKSFATLSEGLKGQNFTELIRFTSCGCGWIF